MIKILSAGVLNSAGQARVSRDISPGMHQVQASVRGTGVVTATVVISGSLDGGTFATIYTVTLNGTSLDSALNASYLDGLWVQATVTAISGTGAVVDVSVS